MPYAYICVSMFLVKIRECLFSRLTYLPLVLHTQLYLTFSLSILGGKQTYTM